MRTKRYEEKRAALFGKGVLGIDPGIAEATVHQSMYEFFNTQSMTHARPFGRSAAKPAMRCWPKFLGVVPLSGFHSGRCQSTRHHLVSVFYSYLNASIGLATAARKA